MNATEQTSQASTETKIKSESKNKIRVDFERTSLITRLRIRFLSVFFLKNVIWIIIRLVLLVGVSFIVLRPFFVKISGSVFSPQDFLDSTVKLIPRNPTFGTYYAIIIENDYFKALFSTAILSLISGLMQMLICTLVGYGFAKFRFRFNNMIFGLVIFTLIIPHQTLYFSMSMKFRFFDFLNIYETIQKFLGVTKASEWKINFMNSSVAGIEGLLWPVVILSLTGLAFKNGLYVLIMRQFFRGFPDELEEASYVDGSGVFRTYLTVILPNAIPMMITVFLFAFTWQWTDEFYVGMFTTDKGPYLLPRILDQIPLSLTRSSEAIQAGVMYTSAINNTMGLLIIAPLILVYIVGQNFLIQGIERTGVTG